MFAVLPQIVQILVFAEKIEYFIGFQTTFLCIKRLCHLGFKYKKERFNLKSENKVSHKATIIKYQKLYYIFFFLKNSISSGFISKRVTGKRVLVGGFIDPLTSSELSFHINLHICFIIILAILEVYFSLKPFTWKCTHAQLIWSNYLKSFRWHLRSNLCSSMLFLLLRTLTLTLNLNFNNYPGPTHPLKFGSGIPCLLFQSVRCLSPLVLSKR